MFKIEVGLLLDAFRRLDVSNGRSHELVETIIRVEYFGVGLLDFIQVLQTELNVRISSILEPRDEEL